VPKTAAIELQPGERIVSRSGGGGGYGDPLDRDPAAVLEDVLEGWVSVEQAATVYGVELRGQTDSGEPAVDEEATRSRRAELRVRPA
jgi:N-methylhydantoinase B